MKQFRIIEYFTKCRGIIHLENTDLWGQSGGSATEHMFTHVIPCIQSPALTNKEQTKLKGVVLYGAQI